MELEAELDGACAWERPEVEDATSVADHSSAMEGIAGPVWLTRESNGCRGSELGNHHHPAGHTFGVGSVLVARPRAKRAKVPREVEAERRTEQVR